VRARALSLLLLLATLALLGFQQGIIDPMSPSISAARAPAAFTNGKFKLGVDHRPARA
jgi:hypothetical protein